MKRVNIKTLLRDPVTRKSLIDGVRQFLRALEGYSDPGVTPDSGSTHQEQTTEISHKNTVLCP